MNSTSRSLGSIVLLAATALGPVGCASDDTDVIVDDLTSLTGRERQLTFEGYVYVAADADDDEIMAAVLAETRSAFGALQTQDVSVATREMANVDPAKLIREPVTVVDPDGGDDQEALRVRYLYTDQAIVPRTMARRTALGAGLLHGDYQAQAERILGECTGNTAEDREFATDIWYVFNPSLDRCQDAMNAEQEAIDADRELLDDPKTEVVPAEIERLYIPITVKLAPMPATAAKIYPEYDRLWSGGITPGKLRVTMLNGLIDHGDPGGSTVIADDPGYWEMMAQMDEIFYARPGLEVVATDPPTDLSSFTVAGEPVTGLTFKDFVNWEIYGTGWPAGLTATERTALRRLVAERLLRRWVTFAETVTIRVGNAEPRPVTLELVQYFGAEDDIEPYRHAIATSDVFLYNGHSYVGSGPLDPANFDESDFPESYQIFFIDSCISFNYYNKDYFAFKARGSQDLDTITNGLESFSDGSGAGQGRFVAALLGGEQPTYLKLLDVASTDGTAYQWGKDALRVVDGELDNVYSPAATPIDVAAAAQ